MYTVRRLHTSIDVPTFLASYVQVASFEALCQQCPHYAKTWSCPPYTFNPLDIWSQYDCLDITAVQLDFSPFPDEMDAQAVHQQMMYDFRHEKDLLDAALMQLEQHESGSRALFAGRCMACEGTCTRVLGEPCIHPEQMHYSIESLGGDVVGLLRELLGVTLEWSSDMYAPHRLVAVGGLLRIDAEK